MVCYDGDFYPYGGERAYTNTCDPVYKFEGKERDIETGNDDFGARYYSNRFGRWLSADWSSVPVAVPYANVTNPQTLNLYSMVADDPESFADLDGHCTMTIFGGCAGGRSDDDDLDHADWVPQNSCLRNTCIIAGGVGHHLISGFRKLFEGFGESDALKAINKLVTGPLADPKTNMFNKLHRLYNPAVDKIRIDMEKELGKPITEFTEKEVGELGRRIFNSKDPAIQDFLKSLSRTARGEAARDALRGALEGLGVAAEELAGGVLELVPVLAFPQQRKWD